MNELRLIAAAGEKLVTCPRIFGLPVPGLPVITFSEISDGIRNGSLLGNVQFGEHLVLYVFVVSLTRGVLFPDFRHDMVSIIFIQLIYPVLLFGPMIMRLHGERFWGYYVLCLGGIMLATLVALLRYYLEAGKESVTEQVSVAIMSLSFVAQIGLLSVLVILLFLVQKAKVT